MDQTQLMVYGTTGYTGQLVATEAVASGLRPVLAGRSAQKRARAARQRELETRIVVQGDAGGPASAPQDVAVVLHCARSDVRCRRETALASIPDSGLC